jgi:hypothetical protein
MATETIYKLVLWDADVFDSILDDASTYFERKAERRKENDQMDKGAFETSTTGAGATPFEEAIAKVEAFRALLGSMPTNMDDKDIPRFCSQLYIQERFMISMVPAIIGITWASIAHKMKAYYMVDFDVPIQAGILSRRAGKTTLASQLIVAVLWMCPNFPFVILAKVIPQANIILENAKKIAFDCFGSTERFESRTDCLICHHPGAPDSKVEVKAGKENVSLFTPSLFFCLLLGFCCCCLFVCCSPPCVPVCTTKISARLLINIPLNR